MTDKKANGAIPAATILLVRDGSQGLETFMVVRHHQIDFASGALVFPGGKVAKGDSDAELINYCRMGKDCNDQQRTLQIAAIREAFEESGVLLARKQGSDALVNQQDLAKLDQYREPLCKDQMSMLQFVQQQNVELALDQLTRYSHWVTPAMMPKRFDTHFYIAAAPADQLAIHDGSESVDSVWITPQQALSDAEAQTRTVIFPTRMNLKKLAELNSVEHALQHYAGAEIITVEPWIEERDGEKILAIPSAAGYGIDGIPIDKMMK